METKTRSGARRSLWTFKLTNHFYFTSFFIKKYSKFLLLNLLEVLWKRKQDTDLNIKLIKWISYKNECYFFQLSCWKYKILPAPLLSFVVPWYTYEQQMECNQPSEGCLPQQWRTELGWWGWTASLCGPEPRGSTSSGWFQENRRWVRGIHGQLCMLPVKMEQVIRKVLDQFQKI